MRDKNVRLGQCEKRLRSFPLEVVNDTFCYVLNIESALSQVRVIDLVQGLGISGGDFLENPFHIAQIRLQFPKHFVD